MVSSESCAGCNGLRGHDRIKEAMCEWFEDELSEATREVDRLTDLFREVCWYNFETQCRKWTHPWPESMGSSHIELHGTKIVIDDSRGRRREVGLFPVYYKGIVRDAPPLPPLIVLKELREATEYQRLCAAQRSAPFDWAPGGKSYLKLLQTTHVPSEYSRRRARAAEAAQHISRRLAEQP